MDKLAVDRFIRKFGIAVAQGNAAVFGGAGLSRESGFVNWKELMRDFAADIRLDIDKETDLISVAQYYKNEMGGNRNGLNQEILNQFTKNTNHNSTLNVLSELPISTYWTTNYDHLIEDTLEQKANYKVDCKRNEENLTINRQDSDVLVYKIHGDIDEPNKAIITKDDYELFEKTHKLFTTALQADLISKTFVFIGYSFNDPNLWQILSRIRILIGENQREHFCFIKELNEQDYTKYTGKQKAKNHEEYLYDKIHQELMIKDLKRYGIQTVLIDSYSDIPLILSKIKKNYITSRIFIAGSCRNYGTWEKEKAYIFLSQLGYQLVKNGYHISSGFVEGVGPQVINGALNAINDYNLNIEKTIVIKPLPLIDGSDKYMNESSKKMFQNNMIENAGIIIFLFGNNYYDGELKISQGVLHDFQRAQEHHKYIIPVGTTGYCAEYILSEIEKNIDEYIYLKPYLHKLKSEKNPQKLVELIISIIKYIKSL